MSINTPGTSIEQYIVELAARHNVGVGQPIRIALEFTRESETAEAALVSAVADVKRAIPTAKLIEVSPDFVGLSDTADGC